MGCTGSGAVNPLTPSKASQPDAATAAADSEVVYWTTFPVTFTMTDPLNGVCLVSKKLGWACGNNGLILKYDGATWEKVNPDLAKNENLMAAAFADENEGWIVGTHGTILHYNNGSWKLDDSQTLETLYSVVVTRSRTVWAVGSNGTILTYNGITWGKIAALSSASGAPTTVAEDIYSIGMSSQNNGWAVGNRGLILRYDGQKWDSYAASPSTEKLNSVSVINDVQAWIVGAYGTILRFNGTAWNKMGSAFSGFDLYQVYMKSDDDGWAAGQDGTLIYYDGSRWISHQKPEGKPSLNAIAFYKDLGFIVGEKGTILKYQPNGEMAKFSFLFKGTVAKQPSKSSPYWTVSYTLMNQSPKASPLVTFGLPIPKGLEPYQPKPTATSTPTVAVSPAVAAPTAPSTLLSPTPTAPVSLSPTPPVSTSASTGITGAWTMKDDRLEWEIGNVSSSEIKTVTVLLQNKKGEKKEYPVLLKAVLKSTDKVMAEADAVTLLASEPKVSNNPVVPTPTSNAFATSPDPVKSPPAAGGDDDSKKGGALNAQSTPSP